MPEILFNSLDKESVKRHAIETFTNFYLLHISVIQGVAFGLLSNKIFSLFGNGNDFPELIKIARMLFPLLMVALVSYQYAIFISIYRRSLTKYDVLIPFAIGLFQIAPAFVIDNAKMT